MFIRNTRAVRKYIGMDKGNSPHAKQVSLLPFYHQNEHLRYIGKKRSNNSSKRVLQTSGIRNHLLIINCNLLSAAIDSDDQTEQDQNSPQPIKIDQGFLTYI